MIAVYLAAVWLTASIVLGLLVAPLLRRNRERPPSAGSRRIVHSSPRGDRP